MSTHIVAIFEHSMSWLATGCKSVCAAMQKCHYLLGTYCSQSRGKILCSTRWLWCCFICLTFFLITLHTPHTHTHTIWLHAVYSHNYLCTCMSLAAFVYFLLVICLLLLTFMLQIRFMVQFITAINLLKRETAKGSGNAVTEAWVMRLLAGGALVECRIRNHISEQ